MYLKLLLMFFCMLGMSFGVDALSNKPEKLLICGICQNISGAVYNTIHNIERLGNQFGDYDVIIYENNSNDGSREILSHWANRNSRVLYIYEDIDTSQVSICRTERIAQARNKILLAMMDPRYESYEYVVMVDLDFKREWPVDEIVKSFSSPINWDVVTANGQAWSGSYWDTFALRHSCLPFGPELLGDWAYNRARFAEGPPRFAGSDWIPVFSAFGGLAIYKKKCFEGCWYSGIAVSELVPFYRRIFNQIVDETFSTRMYLYDIGYPEGSKFSEVPICLRANHTGSMNEKFKPISVCEHVNIHAMMAKNGYNKIFINPKMKLLY